MPDLLQRRPTETVSGLALAASVYGFLTQAAVPTAVAAVLAVLIAFVPAAVTATVDQLRKRAEAVRPARKART